jgi:hypothetical protein
VGELLARRDVAHRHEDDLPLDGDIGVAGMVGVEHGAVALLAPDRRDDEVLGELDLRGAEDRLERPPPRPGQHVAALDGHDLARRDGLPGEQPLPLNGLARTSVFGER